ncbi:MAG: PQQ-binding-like beta-propeller repeat protein [Candidatus Paracaedibacteraceae bacterium]|nr:PQQ-binding-like beta-propeller repeat protein [Candidatus Paracaedibacteraceae bacterium]
MTQFKKLFLSNYNALISCVALGAATFILGGCDSKDTTPLPGERVSFLNYAGSVKADSSASGMFVTVPTAVENMSWPQMGGRVDHALLNVSLAEKIAPLWKTDIGTGSSDDQRLIASPVTDENHVYAMDASGLVSALSIKTGAIVWQKETSPDGKSHDTLGGGIAVDHGVVYATTSFGEIVAMKADTGEEIWRKTGYAPFRSSPSVKNNHVYCQSLNNELIALSAAKGDVIWTHSGIPESALLLGGGKPACSGDTVIAAYTSGEVHALSQVNGQPLWSDTITPVARIDTVTSIPHIRARPVIDDNQVFVISHGGRMTAIDFKTGTRQWQKEIGGIRTPVVAGGFVYVLTGMNELVCMDRKSGAICWVAGLPRVDKDEGAVYLAGPIMAGDTLIVTSSKGEIIRINPKDGEITNTIKVDDHSILLAPIVAQKTLFILTDNATIHAYK